MTEFDEIEEALVRRKTFEELENATFKEVFKKSNFKKFLQIHTLFFEMTRLPVTQEIVIFLYDEVNGIGKIE